MTVSGRGGTAVPRAGRRAVIAGASAFIGVRPALAGTSAPELRLGVLRFGTVQWVADVIRRHGLDAKHGFALRNVTLANTDAGRVSLMAGASDVIVSDWQFVAAQRAAGTKLCFAPFSSSTGGIITAPNSTIRGLAQLRGVKLGVAGGPVDKSWLIVRAATRATQGIDLATDADVVYGAPPLLGAKLQQGEFAAVLTFWNFAAKLEASGFREVVSVADCARMLGISPRISLLGFVFHEDWAKANRAVIDGFLAAIVESEALLAASDAEWQVVRPLMDADDDALFARLRDRFRAGTVMEDAAGQIQAARRLFAILRETGGPRATEGIDTLPAGVFWPAADEAS